MYRLIMALLFLSFHAKAKIPDWATHNTTKLIGQVLTTVCHGTGPSLDIARSEALKSCQINASQFLRSKIKVKSLSVETEKSVGFHQEITNEDEIEGLRCDPQQDQVEDSESQFSVWIKCKFDLKRVSSSPIHEKSESLDNSHLNTLEPSRVDSGNDIQAKYIFISTVPKCESVIIKGTSSRTIQCTENPLRLQIKDGDKSILIRAKGYKPKTVMVKGVDANDTIQVLLDLL